MTGRKTKQAARSTVFRAIVGQPFHPKLACAGLIRLDMGDDSKTRVINNIATMATVKVNNFKGVYLLTDSRLTPASQKCGRAGLPRMNLRTTVVAVNMSEITNFADISFAYGAGMNYHLKKSTFPGLDFTRYNTEGKSKIRGAALAAARPVLITQIARAMRPY